MNNADNWLEPLLTDQLRSQAAPAELWGNIRDGRAVSTTSGNWSGIFALPVLVLGAVSIGYLVLSPAFQSGNSPSTLAVLGLNRAPETLEFRSNEAPAIRDWVRSQTGLDVALANPPAASIRLLGARLIRAGGLKAAEIAFRVGDSRAALVISRPEGAARGGHRGALAEPRDGVVVSSWTSHLQNYTLACASPKEFQAACRLCHPGQSLAGVASLASF